MSKQRSAVKKTEIAAAQHKRKLQLLEILLILTMPFVAWFLWKWVQEENSFPIKQISIVGQYEHLDSADIQEVVFPLIQNSFFVVNLATIKQHLLHNPWVQDVNLERAFPDRLIIEITEYVPIARWGEGSLLTNEGMIFTPEQHDIVHLPLLLGPYGTHLQMLNTYRNLQAYIDHELVITELQLTAQQSWIVVLNESFYLQLGREDIYQRFQRFITIFPELLISRKSEIEYVDLRYENGIAVKWK